MRSIFHTPDRDDILQRIDNLQLQDQARWGKMKVAGMLHHCVVVENYFQGAFHVRRDFRGRLFGRVVLRKILKDDATQLGRNAPTDPVFLVGERDFDFEIEKQNWKNLIDRYASDDIPAFTHWFFGKMSKAELGQFVYKHADHHLRQFGR